MHPPAAERTVNLLAGIARFIGRQMFLQQPAGQRIAQLAGPIFTLLERDQAVVPVGPEHLIERLSGLLQKIPPPRFEFPCSNARHD